MKNGFRGKISILTKYTPLLPFKDAINAIERDGTYPPPTIRFKHLSHQHCITYSTPSPPPSLSGLITEDDRKLIESQIRTYGGSYHPDLSRSCTHLLCASATGKKYEAALKWGIHCVGVEWLFQSIERGMTLEGRYFRLDIPS